MRYEDLKTMEVNIPMDGFDRHVELVVRLRDLPQRITTKDKLPSPHVLVCVYYTGVPEFERCDAKYGMYCVRGDACWWESANGSIIPAPTQWRALLR